VKITAEMEPVEICMTRPDWVSVSE